MQPHCIADLGPRALAVCLVRDQDFLEFLWNPDNLSPEFNLEQRCWAQSQPQGHCPTETETHSPEEPKTLLYFSILSILIFHHFLHQYFFRFLNLKIWIIFFSCFFLAGVYSMQTKLINF